MEVKQIYELLNDVTGEVLGKTDLVQEDLQNIVEVGDEIMNSRSIDHYVRSLVDHIGRVIFVNRQYEGVAPSVLRDGWEYGAILEKIAAKLPNATENESWELEDGQSYDPNIFYKPEVYAKFYNKRTTWEIPMSFTEMQVRSAFSSAAQVNGFISMLFTGVENSRTIKTSEMVMRTINNMTAETLKDANGLATPRAVNLLTQFNAKFHPVSGQITAAQAIMDKDFIRFAAFTMSLYEVRMRRMSTLFNVGQKDRFTPASRLNIIMLAEFATAADVYLQSDVWHNEYTRLPKAEIVPYWQGTGDVSHPFEFGKTSKINVVPSSGGYAIVQDGILAVMFDRDALGVCNERQRVTTNYNPKAEFYTNWYKTDCGYFNDLNENFIVFYVADSNGTKSKK